MRGVLLYPDRYQKYGTDTRVLDDSTLVCPSTVSGYERSPYLRTAVAGYSCTAVHLYVSVRRVHGTCQCQGELTRCLRHAAVEYSCTYSEN
jgi:hypothetical protein